LNISFAASDARGDGNYTARFARGFTRCSEKSTTLVFRAGKGSRHQAPALIRKRFVKEGSNPLRMKVHSMHGISPARVMAFCHER
jgi:hypothetical protein